MTDSGGSSTHLVSNAGVLILNQTVEPDIVLFFKETFVPKTVNAIGIIYTCTRVRIILIRYWFHWTLCYCDVYPKMFTGMDTTDAARFIRRFGRENPCVLPTACFIPHQFENLTKRVHFTPRKLCSTKKFSRSIYPPRVLSAGG